MNRKSFIATIISGIAGWFVRRSEGRYPRDYTLATRPVLDPKLKIYAYVDSRSTAGGDGIISNDQERAKANPFKTIRAAIDAMPQSTPSQYLTAVGTGENSGYVYRAA